MSSMFGSYTFFLDRFNRKMVGHKCVKSGFWTRTVFWSALEYERRPNARIVIFILKSIFSKQILHEVTGNEMDFMDTSVDHSVVFPLHGHRRACLGYSSSSMSIAIASAVVYTLPVKNSTPFSARSCCSIVSVQQASEMSQVS